MKRWIGLAALTAMAMGGPAAAFDLEAHRGGRGLKPENTLPSFANALSIGVSTLELDLGTTRDGEIIVSHERTLNPVLARGPDGLWIDPPPPRLIDLTLDEVRQFDVGRIKPDTPYAKSFAKQQAIDGTRMPTLKEVFALVRKSGNTAVRFNIETKLSPLDPQETLAPEPFATKLVDFLRKEGMAKRSIIQSFDWRTLQVTQKIAPDIKTSYLTLQRGNDTVGIGKPEPSPWLAGFNPAAYGNSVPRTIKAAGGAIWSPYFKDMTKASLREAQSLGLEVVVWTVNEKEEMADLIEMGVDGIITDFPDRLREVMAQRDLPLPAPTPVAP